MAIRERVARLLAEMPGAPQYATQGATVFIDLERSETQRAYTPLEVTRALIGGRGANMYYLFRLLDETRTPLDPDIPIIFGSGPLTGLVPSAARGNCTSWAPDSGVLMDTNAGDYFPSFLRMNGIDHLVIYGRAPRWTLMIIREGVLEFHDAAPYVGLDNIDMRDAIARDLGGVWKRNMSMVNITRAGENLVLTSGIMAGPKAIYARGGPGAKMGALQLKAIVTLSALKEFQTAIPYKAYNRHIAGKLLGTSVVKRALSTSGPSSSMPTTSIPTARGWRAASAAP
jgi:aldehyde:ferredoxin oxidoreductase